MNIGEVLYWRLIQRELRCDTCCSLDRKNLYKGVPCSRYTEFEGEMECPFREPNAVMGVLNEHSR